MHRRLCSLGLFTALLLSTIHVQAKSFPIPPPASSLTPPANAQPVEPPPTEPLMYYGVEVKTLQVPPPQPTATSIATPPSSPINLNTRLLNFQNNVCQPQSAQSTQSPLHPVVVGVIGAAKQQTSEILCVPGTGNSSELSYFSSPYFLSHYALEKIAGGMSSKAIDHIQVMVVRKAEPQPAPTGRRKSKQPPGPFDWDIYRLSTDWPGSKNRSRLGHISNRENQRLLGWSHQADDLLAVYVTVDGVSDGVIFAMVRDLVGTIAPVASSFSGAVVGASVGQK